MGIIQVVQDSVPVPVDIYRQSLRFLAFILPSLNWDYTVSCTPFTKCCIVLRARLVFVFQQNRQCLNLLCLHQCHYPDSYPKLDCVCVEWRFVFMWVMLEGEKILHWHEFCMHGVAGFAWMAALALKDVWPFRSCFLMCVSQG